MRSIFLFVAVWSTLIGTLQTTFLESLPGFLLVLRIKAFNPASTSSLLWTDGLKAQSLLRATFIRGLCLVDPTNEKTAPPFSSSLGPHCPGDRIEIAQSFGAPYVPKRSWIQDDIRT